MKNSNIIKGILMLSPKSPSMDISASLILPIFSCRNNCLSSKLLQSWLNGYIIADFIKPFCSNVTYLIVTNRGLSHHIDIMAWSGVKGDPQTQ